MKTSNWAITATILCLAGTAFAQDQKPPVPGHIRVGATEQAAARAYWTVDRMANAKPMPLPTVDAATAPASASPLVPSGAAKFSPGGPPTIIMSAENLPSQTFEMLNTGEPAASPATTPFSYTYPFTSYRPPVIDAYPYSTVGKLFLVIPPGASVPAGDYVCSASVTNNTFTVITARHCMYDYPSGIWFTNLTFDPAYDKGPNSKYGNSWTVYQAETWVSSSSTYDFDIGFLQMNDLDGAGCNGSDGSATIGSYTGWLGWTYNGDFTQRQWDVFGYPQDSPFAGNHMYQDEAATGALNPMGYNNVIEIGNPWTAGSSGGPWIIGLNPKNATDPGTTNNIIPGTNFVNGLNSFRWTNPSQPLAINGPEFQTYNFLNLLTAYNGLSCP
jgi:V8-like Glu-specific endopeptidase